jgi:homoserine dehydrogenase
VTALLKVGIAGLGTVGSGVLKILQQHGDMLSARCGSNLVVTSVSARDRNKDRGLDLDGIAWCENPVDLASADVDVVVEVMGGSDGPAKDLVADAIAAGKSVVTANKALIALHGHELGAAAEQANVALNFEAAVAGGIPVIKMLREGLAANVNDHVFGILNGTCNYILTEMEKTGRDFDDVLADAQALGYAEADPTFDVDGIDTAHKLAILASVTFGTTLDFESVYVEGIRQISAADIQFAAELGYRIKLLGIARLSEEGIEQRVHPCMVPLDTAIAHVDGVTNAVVVDGDRAGRTVIEGQGAGEGPTASSVVSDIMDIARGLISAPFGHPGAQLRTPQVLESDRHSGRYYIRLEVIDQPGVMADITEILRDQDLSLASFIQRGRAPGEQVSVVILTHTTDEGRMAQSLGLIEGLDSVIEPPRMIRIKHL